MHHALVTLLVLLGVGCAETPAAMPTGCADVACTGHGTCSDADANLICQCETGYHAEGLECIEDGMTSPCAAVTCSQHGSCRLVAGAASCACDAGFVAEGLECVALPPPLCDGVTCDGHGSCVVADGVARCDCDSGFRAEGLSCVNACAMWQTDTVLDIPATQLRPTVRVNGARLTEDTTLVFRSTTTADLFAFTVHSDGPLGSQRRPTVPVSPGTYAVTYQRDSAANQTMPLNQNLPLGCWSL